MLESLVNNGISFNPDIEMGSLDQTAEVLRVLGDPTRVRLLSLLAAEELSVAELVRVTRLPQTRVSTHLARLREAGLVRDRRNGNGSYYAIDEEGAPEEVRRLWETLRAGTRDPLLEEDRLRVREVLEQRGGSWADRVAGQMERHYSPGRSWESALRGLLGLCTFGRVLDVASGDGAIAELIAPRAEHVTCLDLSPRVAAAGAARLAHLRHVVFRVGDMHELPFADASFDQVLLAHSLSYARDPARALAEAARVLRPRGRLAALALAPHRHQELCARYGHLQAGFSPEELRELARRAGLDVSLCAVTSREKRRPHFEVVALHAIRP
jgi:ArsR family transcriptional regulator